MNKRSRRPYGKRKIKKDVVLDKNETNSSLWNPHKLYRKHAFCLEKPIPQQVFQPVKVEIRIEEFSNISVDIWKSESNWDENSKRAKHNIRLSLS